MRGLLLFLAWAGFWGSAGCGSSQPAPQALETEVVPTVPLNSPEAEWLLGQWALERDAQTRVIIVAAEPPRFMYEWRRDRVDTYKNSKLQEPTTCSYRYVSTQFSIEAKSYWKDPAITHAFAVLDPQVELLEDEENSLGCDAFIQEMKDYAKNAPWYIGFHKDAEGKLVQSGWVLEKAAKETVSE